MAHKSFAELLGEVSVTAGGGKKVADIFQALVPPEGTAVTIAHAGGVGSQAATSRSAMRALLPGAVGAAVGAVVWSDHRVLGAVAGHALAVTAPGLLKGGHPRRTAVFRLGVEASAITGALLWPEHPVLGFGAGLGVATLVSALIGRSPANEVLGAVAGWICRDTK